MLLSAKLRVPLFPVLTLLLWAFVGQTALGSTPAVGSAAISPTLTALTSQTVTVTVYGQSPDTLTNVNIIVPNLWLWSFTTGNVSLVGGGTPSTAISGDTVEISGMIVAAAESIQIMLNNITPPDSTNFFTFVVETGQSSGPSTPLATSPQILVHGTPPPISQLTANNSYGVPLLGGQYVTAEGIVTVANEFDSPSFIQDNTGGMAIFDSAFSATVHDGDQVVVLGLVTENNGLYELTAPTLLQTVSTGNTVTPLVLTCAQIAGQGANGYEPYLGMLVRVNEATATTSNFQDIATWAVTGAGTDYNLNDATGTTQIRVNAHVNFANTPAPQEAFDVVGVVSQYKPTEPYVGGYEFTPRSAADILSGGPVIETAPVESNLAPTSFSVSWTTINGGTSAVRYGVTSSYEMGVVSDSVLTASHSVTLTGLTAATIYQVQAFSVSGAGDTSTAANLVVSTSSPPQSTGQLNVYFNFSVNTSVAFSEFAQGNVVLVSKLLSRINNATHSIDAALYSLSASQGDAVANALVAAQNRGVRVRVVCETTNSTESGFSILQGGGVTVINQTFDPTWNSSTAGIMHNKFLVFDYVGGAPDSVWVWGGSYNPTGEGSTEDRQNVIEIQDVALAAAYTLEMNQMWGSNTATPNAAHSKFGSDKSNITPHHFLINGVPVSSYFSPSDGTTSQISATISQAQHSLSGCMYVFTRSDLADILVAKKNAGKAVREVIDNSTEDGDQYTFLLNSGVDVHLKGFSPPALLHHKYSIVDGDHTAGTPYLLTGSHDWTNAAENYNDENEEIVQSSRIANLYLQEFAARYYEAGGTDSIHAVNDAPHAVCAPNKAVLNFDTVLVNGAKQDTFKVTNSGNIPLTISSAVSSSARFVVAPESVTVAAGSSYNFLVTFTPNAVGTFTGKVTLTHNAATSPDSVLFSGFGGQPVFNARASALNFDSVFIGLTKQDSVLVTNTGSDTLTISSVISTDSLFAVAPSCAKIPPADTGLFVVSFSPESTGVRNAAIVISNNAAGGSDTLTAQGVGRFKTFAFSPLAGWNLISLPLVLPNGRQTAVFPQAASNPFIYNGGYIASDSLIPEAGYWLKFPSTATDTLAGKPIVADTIPLAAGWNMVGAMSYPENVDSIQQIPPGNVLTNFYGFDNGYTAVDSLYPASGYWVKADAAGSLVVAGNIPSKASRKIAPVVAPKILAKTLAVMPNRLTFTDAGGHKQTLSFQAKQGGSASLVHYELPPVPPAGAFDVRFNSNRLIEFYDTTRSDGSEFPILLQGMKFPVTVNWNIVGTDPLVFTLKMRDGKTSTTKLVKQGSISVTSGSLGGVSLSVSPVVPMPKTYALAQNYPNPFNPTTTINYQLPWESFVHISIFNILGQEVQTLVHATQSGGYKSVQFNASNLASGVYFYRISAGQSSPATAGGRLSSFTDVKKMLLVK